ncbi:MAG TPA: pyridoxamine 5'-phosphate oxidase family protein, partial [Acidimicrobiales bacterium]|nr:pyridoxamine 5'-phosphate oxidase family protein [Acidimicrobiales bacterium]
RTTVRRLPARASYDRIIVHGILDEGLVAHVGLTTERGPLVIPMMYVRVDERVYIHGSAANHLLRTASSGIEICAAVTLLDGLVLARSAFHHSMNYRSVVMYGTAAKVTDPGEKRTALDALVDRVAIGRSVEARPPSEEELRSTLVLALELNEVSAKVRTGDPLDDEADLDWPVWAGVIPLRLVAGEREPAADLRYA